MTPQEKDLRGKRQAKFEEARTLIAGGFTPEVRTKYDALMSEIKDYDGDIARYRQASEAEAEERTRQEAEERARAAGRPVLPQPGAPANEDRSAEDNIEVEKRNKQYQRAYNHYLRTRDDSQLRAMNSTTGSQGGYAIPTLTEPDLERAILQFGGIASFLEQMPTTTGEQINWPLNNDTANSGTELGENVAATEQDIVLGTKAMTVGLFSTGMIQIPRTLIRDSAFDLAAKVTAILGERAARLKSYKIINGSTGTSFDSLIGAATIAGTSAAPTALALNDVATLFEGVDPGYANGPDAKFFCNRGTQIYMSVQRNSYGTPIFPLDQDGLVTKLFGRDLVIDQNMPNLAAANKSLGFGALHKYILRNVGTMEVMRLEERYAELNQIAFLGWWAGGGSLIDAGTHPIQVLQQHA